MYPTCSQSRNDSVMSCLNPNSSYHTLPSDIRTTLTQPFQSSVVAMSPVGGTTSSPRYKDNTTGCIYTFEQMFNFMWRQHPSQPKQLVTSGSYTDLATGMTFTHSQMMVMTRPTQSPQSIQSQSQFQQSSQQQVHIPSNVYNVQQRKCQQTMQLQLQQHQQLQQQQQQLQLQWRQQKQQKQQQLHEMRQLQAQMMQQAQGQQRVQQPLQQQQQIQHLSYHTTNTGQIIATDQHGNQWTQEQYREMLRRQQLQLQMAQLSATVSPGLQPQVQQVSRPPPPMTVGQRPVNNAGRSLVSQPHGGLLQSQKMNIQSPQTLINRQPQEQPRPALPVMTSYSQQPLNSSQSDCQLAQEQLDGIVRLRQAPRSLLPPSKPSKVVKAPAPVKSRTQLEAHNQGVRKTPKQPRRQPTPFPVPSKVPEATRTVQRTSTAKVNAIPDPVTDKSPSSTMAPPVPKSNMPPPPLTPNCRDGPSTHASASISRCAAASQHTPYPPTSATNTSSPITNINRPEIEQNTPVQGTGSNYLSPYPNSEREDPSIQDNVTGPSDKEEPPIQEPDSAEYPVDPYLTADIRNAHPPITPFTTADLDTAPLPSPYEPCPPETLADFTTSSLFTFSPDFHRNFIPNMLPPYQPIPEGVYPDPDEQLPAMQEEPDAERAPDERRMSEEKAQLEWEIMCTGERYEGEDGQGKEE